MIQSTYRSYSATQVYTSAVSSIVSIQSMARRWIAVTLFNQLKQLKSTAAATKIQATWRGFVTCDKFMQTVLDVVLIQSLTRRRIAKRCCACLREERQLAEDSAATTMASAWRAYICNRNYEQTIDGEHVDACIEGYLCVCTSLTLPFWMRCRHNHLPIPCSSQHRPVSNNGIAQ